MTVCRFAGATQPRILPHRHLDDSHVDGCTGCLPCTAHHCVVCGVEHVDELTCGACVGAVRDDLGVLKASVGQLLAESLLKPSVTHTGPLSRMPGGEAAFLIGPAADLEAWGYMTSHAEDTHAAHRHDAYDSDGEPLLLTLDSWMANWRDERGQPPSDLKATIGRAWAYLHDNLTWAAQHHWAFDEFAKDIRRSRSKVEAVLHDGTRDDPAGVACFSCGGQLVRRMTDTGMDDNWSCRKCRRVYTQPEYHLAVRAKIEGAKAS